MRTTYIHSHTTSDNSFGEAAINAAFGAGLACGQSWSYGVWVYDKDKADCVFYGPLSNHGEGSKKNAHSRNYGPFKTKNKKHEAKVAKNIIIDMVRTTATDVMVDWSAKPMSTSQQLRINRFAFEQWLYETCRLDWCLHELSSHQSGINSTMSTDNYWLYGDYGVQYQDLITYIIEHRMAFVPCG